MNAQINLRALGSSFLSTHHRCFAAALGGPFTHIATVPSTRGRRGQHQLYTILAGGVRLPHVLATANDRYSADGVRYEHCRLFNERLRKAPEFDESRCSLGDAGGDRLAGGGLVVED
ncbi:hypothetical protein GCM10010435_58450 [Winogradskya consettensis]|uniref:Uncharacterized protein n=1 Tax=Winogradskya consettensis TaxID=113560 RepID=A0A919VKS3_9ACTN|nr:hypothetical protein Aco04nite_03870 [Actinoplanes consettensis]